MSNLADVKRELRHQPFVAQLIIVPVARVEFNIVPTFGSSERGSGGFGSTGKH